MKRLYFTFICLILVCRCAVGQHSDHGKAVEQLSFQSVLTQHLSDPELKDYKMESSVMTLTPGAEDTVSHRHDCELFGYVLEGSVIIGLEHKQPNTFRAGEMFYEKRNILHSLTRNTSREKPAKVLLVFIIKNGRAGYTHAYPNHK